MIAPSSTHEGQQTTYNIHDAKTHFSELVARAERGEEIVIARSGKPIVRLQLVEPPRREFHFMDLDIPLDAFLIPMTEEELAEWE
jgi:prevent-host-death family protein